MGEFVVNIQPSDETAPYIYAVMTDSEYDDFYPDNLYDYFYGRYYRGQYPYRGLQRNVYRFLQ